jgi:hypothetical protein
MHQKSSVDALDGCTKADHEPVPYGGGHTFRVKLDYLVDHQAWAWGRSRLLDRALAPLIMLDHGSLNVCALSGIRPPARVSPSCLDAFVALCIAQLARELG